MSAGTERNHCIDFFRFFFIIMICIYHYGIQAGPDFHHGYIGVEFFFIVSGFFLYKSFAKNKTVNPLDYLINRVKRLWGKYIIALFLYWFIYLGWMLIQKVDFSLGDYCMRLLSDSFMLQGTGLSFRGLCTPLWYVGSLVVASTFVYSLLNNNEKLSLSLLLPFGSLFGYTLLTTYGTFDFYHSFDGFLFLPLVRAFSGISVGVVLCVVSQEKGESLMNSRRVIDIMAIVSLILLLLFVSDDFRVDGNNYVDNFLLLFIILLVLDCIVTGSVCQKLFGQKVWSSLGGIAYEMLLIHSPLMIVINFCRKFIPMNEWIWLVIYLIIVVVCSYIFKFLYDSLMKIRSNRPSVRV